MKLCKELFGDNQSTQSNRNLSSPELKQTGTCSVLPEKPVRWLSGYEHDGHQLCVRLAVGGGERSCALTLMNDPSQRRPTGSRLLPRRRRSSSQEVDKAAESVCVFFFFGKPHVCDWRGGDSCAKRR